MMDTRYVPAISFGKLISRTILEYERIHLDEKIVSLSEIDSKSLSDCES